MRFPADIRKESVIRFILKNENRQKIRLTRVEQYDASVGCMYLRPQGRSCAYNISVGCLFSSLSVWCLAIPRFDEPYSSSRFQRITEARLRGTHGRKMTRNGGNEFQGHLHRQNHPTESGRAWHQLCRIRPKDSLRPHFALPHIQQQKHRRRTAAAHLRNSRL